MSDMLLSLKDITKSFTIGVQEVKVLKGVTFDVKSGDFVTIFGPSGCGKSTLLHTILGLEAPSSGEVIFLGQNLYDNTSEDDRSEFRELHIGMVYQQPNWIKALTVIENVAFPLSLQGIDKVTTLQKAMIILQNLEMANWANYATSELSSGQQQKIALARALVTDPEVLIADEPTGNLDYESGQELMQLLAEYNQKGKSVVMVTHDLEYLKYSKTAVRMLDGVVVDIYDEKNKNELLKEVKSKRGVTHE